MILRCLATITLGLAAVAGCAEPKVNPVRSLDPELRQAVTGAIVPDGHMFAIDLAVGEDGLLHLLWWAFSGPHNSHSRICYQRSSDAGRVWTEPVVISSTGGGRPRIFVSPRRLHVLMGNLDHYLSEDEGRSWSKVDRLTDLEDGPSVAFDAVCVEETLLVVHSIVSELASAGEFDSLSLFITRWEPSGQKSRRFLGRHSDSPLSAPGLRVLASKQVLHLVHGTSSFRNESREYAGDDERIHYPVGRLQYWRSLDQGRTWNVADDLPLPGGSGTLAHPAGAPGSISDVDFVMPSGRRLVLFVGRGGFVGVESISETRWSDPRLIVEYFPSANGSFQSALATTARNDTVALAWIDRRFQRSERSWRGFLKHGPIVLVAMGVEWRNNDVFVSLVDGAGEYLGRLARTEPIRLTPDLGSANCVRTQFVGDELVCVWSGRDRVDPPGPHGKHLANQVFCARVPVRRVLASRLVR
jgi:hypothetical protein